MFDPFADRNLTPDRQRSVPGGKFGMDVAIAATSLDHDSSLPLTVSDYN